MSKKRNDFFLNDVATTLNDGGVVILPTDTIYGFAVKYGDEAAKKRVYEIKGREFTKELAFVVNSYEMLHQIADVDDEIIKKLSAYFPGALTIVAKKKNHIISSMDTIAVRMINNEFINKLIEKIKAPLLLTSANKSNQQVIGDPYLLFELFENDVDVIVMGPVLENQPSTIIDLTCKQIKLLRKGKIDFEEIKTLIYSN